MITFGDIYGALRKERASDKLQELPRNFIKEAYEYFDEKKDFSNKETDIFSDALNKNKKKLENAISSYKELMRLRKKKILNLAFVASEVGVSKKDFENMLDFERALFENLVKALEKYNQDLNSESSEPAKESKYRLVRFLEDVPAFLGFDNNEIGPFRKGEIANLEKEVVEILGDGKKVEILDE